jgi:hypothetical protein
VLDPNVHPFLDVPVADDLVDNNTNSTGSDVINDTSPTVDDSSIGGYMRLGLRRTRGSIYGACPSVELRSP